MRDIKKYKGVKNYADGWTGKDTEGSCLRDTTTFGRDTMTGGFGRGGIRDVTKI